MSYDYLIFDLDGTLSDPSEGFCKSVNHALARHGYLPRSDDDLHRFIGPPIDTIFTALLDSDDTVLIQTLVASYRERYIAIGYAENRLYDGIADTLETLAASGVTLGVCTSKRGDIAERVLELFGIRDFFAFVSGGDVGVRKSQQLQELLAGGRITPLSIMIGDRAVDLHAAHDHGLAAAGVLWGFGKRAELTEAVPHFILERPAALTALLD